MDKEFLRKKIVERGECWALNDSGRAGILFVGGRSYVARREFYKAFVGYLKPGKKLRNLCGHKWCVRPEHLDRYDVRDSASSRLIRGAEHEHTPIGKFLAELGLSSPQFAYAIKSKTKEKVSVAAVRAWRQGGYPKRETEESIRQHWPDFPVRPICEGTE